MKISPFQLARVRVDEEETHEEAEAHPKDEKVGQQPPYLEHRGRGGVSDVVGK